MSEAVKEQTHTQKKENLSQELNSLPLTIKYKAFAVEQFLW